MKHYLFNETIAKDAEMEYLSQRINQIANGRECINVHAIDFGRLIGQQSQANGWCQHVQ